MSMYLSCKFYSEIMGGRWHLSPEKWAQCVALHKLVTAKYILLHCCIVSEMLSGIHQETGSNQYRSGGGSSHVSTPRYDRLLYKIVSQNPMHTSTQITHDWQQQYGVHCRSRTMDNLHRRVLLHWGQNTPEYFQRLYASLPACTGDVIHRCGYPTRC